MTPMTTLGDLIGVLKTGGQTLDESLLGQKVQSLCFDSRKAGPGKLFIALKGTASDGHQYVRQALEAGCLAAVVEHEISDALGLPLLRVADSHQALALLATRFHANPASRMTMIAITGTNGKTTTSFMLEAILREAGCRVGVIGTVNYRYPLRDGRMHVEDAALTTPEPVFLQGLLRRMADEGVSHVIMETSSHAIRQQRLAGLVFDLAVFTNLSRDHLDYHQSMEEYFQAKQDLFTRHLKPAGKAVVIADRGQCGKNGEDYASRLAAGLGRERTICCGLDPANAVWAGDVRLATDGLRCVLHLADGVHALRSWLTGEYNVRNLLAAAACAQVLGIPGQGIVRGLARLERVAGRLDRVVLPGDKGFLPAVFIDYAHTPDALEKALSALRPLTRGRLICVFGCGGDRDRGKRPLMGETAARLADLVVLTSDNPRSEEPEAILASVEEGIRSTGKESLSLASLCAGKVQGYLVEGDRRIAIRAACAMAVTDDVVLIAGKGHETYQLVKGKSHHFDDWEESQAALLAWTPLLLVRATGGKLMSGQAGCLLRNVVTDTRAVEAGDIFVALAGERFDGHDFVAQAVERGAAVLVVHHSVRVPDTVAVIRVRDTLQALGDLAGFRRRLLGPMLTVLAITGSSGKTTVKEMTACIVEEHYRQTGSSLVLKTLGNLNNRIGLPLSLLPADGRHGTAVLEMGMNQPGEIAALTAIADPDAGLINNIQPAHLEGLGSIEGVARAKGELFMGMRETALRVVNLDDTHCRALVAKTSWRRIGFAATAAGRRYHPEVWATRCHSLGDRGMRFTLHTGSWQGRLTIRAAGQHSVSNALAAAALAHAAGIPVGHIKAGLERYQGFARRMEPVTLPGGILLINDCYNANPASMAAALRTVAGFGGKDNAPIRHAALLGDMLELGGESRSLHRETGALVAGLDYDFLAVKGALGTEIAAGALEQGMAADTVYVAQTSQQLASWLYELIMRGHLRAGDYIVLKGSRGMRMEEVLASLRLYFGLSAEGDH